MPVHAWYDDSLARAVTGEDLKLQQRAARAAPLPAFPIARMAH